jgi:hypothetical protein
MLNSSFPRKWVGQKRVDLGKNDGRHSEETKHKRKGGESTCQAEGLFGVGGHTVVAIVN